MNRAQQNAVLAQRLAARLPQRGAGKTAPIASAPMTKVELIRHLVAEHDAPAIKPDSRALAALLLQHDEYHRGEVR